jgi:gliding motility-associated-like protein
MKKITLLLLFLFISISGYSQLALEGFENTTGPDAPPSTNWTLGTGNWAVFDTSGSPVRWETNNALPYQGANAAYVNREEIGSGNTSEEYLATPPVQIPTTGVLRFYTRMFTSGPQGTIYQIKVAPVTGSQTNPNDYVLIQQWSEDELITPTSNFNVYTEKTVDLGTAFGGQFVYVAFVKVFTQPDNNFGGDRWLVDDVIIDAACLAPTGLTISGITSNSASLNWTNPNGSGATTWEVIVTPSLGAPITYPAYNGALPFIATGLSPNTTYSYRVRAVCTSGISSPYSAASANFTTSVAPAVCGGNFVDSGSIGGNYSNNENRTTTICPVNPGDLVTVTFTAFNVQNNSDFLRVYDGSDATAPLLANLTGTTLPPAFTASSVSGCLTFVFTSNATTTAAGWASNVTCNPPPACRIPTAVTAVTPTTTSVTLNWTQPTNPDLTVASTFDIIALPCGSAAPTAGSIPTANDITAAAGPSYVLTGLTSATCYDIYIRAVCATNSGWSAFPTTVSTLVAPPVCGGNFVDTGGTTGNYGNNENLTSVICPVTSGDAVTVTFTAFNTQAGSDILRVYDGDNASATLLATLSGTALPPSFTSSAPSGCLTFVFTSNATTAAAGWLANVTCAPAPACPKPVGLTTTGLSPTSVSFGWTSIGSATSWQVIALPCSAPAPTNATTGWITTSANPHIFTSLNTTTCYNFYVRSDCGGLSGLSEWAGPQSFTTIAPGLTCAAAITVGSLPYTTNDNTANYADNQPIEGSPGATGCGSTSTYLNGNDVVYSFTPTFTGTINVAMTPAGTWSGIFAYSSCANIGVNCLAGIANSGTGIRTFDLPVTVGSTYYFVISTWPDPQTTGYTLVINRINCVQPANATVAGISSNSALASWGNPGAATSWQVAVQPAATGIPTGSGVVTTTNTNSPLSGLTPLTNYEYYVRADCGDGTFSLWTGPVPFTTAAAPPACGGNFYDAGGPNSDYPTGVTDTNVTICPTNPGDVVTVTFTSFETEATWDGLYVFDGNTIGATQIPSANAAGNVPGGVAGSFWGLLTGANLPGPFTSSSADGCLTFRFRTDGFGVEPGWAANVTCSPAPNCLKPTSLTVANVTSTSALLGWTEPSPGTVTQWEVLVLPFGSPAPLPTTTGGVITSLNPSLITGLLPGTRYTFYVRGICPTSGTSLWSTGLSFLTLIINDDCSGAIFAPVNSSNICQQVTAGTITGATASTPGITAPCIGNADDDVWFQFVASNPFLTVSLLNVTGTTTNLNFGVYSGLCGTLTQLFCSTANNLSGVVNGLTIGQTYFVRVYSNGGTAQTTTFNLCISTPSSCLLGQAACQGLSYPNIQGVINQPAIGCLIDPRNPTYYTINVSLSGPINLLLTQSTTQGGTPNLDVDYAAWGPFTSQATACAAIGNPPTLAPGIGVPVTQTTGCSFSAASTETLNITNAIAGQVYVILITNYSNNPGFISLTQTNVTAPGAGFYECCPDAFFAYNPVSFCRSAGTSNPTPTIANGSLAGVFSSTLTPGLVFVDSGTNTGSTSGQVNILASAPGNYFITNTVSATASCPAKERSYTISITEPTSGTISYPAAGYCKNITTAQPLQTGTSGGSYSAIPNIGLSINPTTGQINPSLSSPGVYTVVYGLPGSICSSGNPSAQVEIYPQPNITQPAPIVACYSYTLPALTVGNYYSQSQLTGPGTTPMDISFPITSTQTVYIYALSANGCPNEKSFTVTINTVPTPTFLPPTPSACATATGSVTVTGPIGTSPPPPTNLFISEVTDSNWGSLSYVELYNGTNSSINLSTYSIKTANNGGAYTFTLPLNNVNLVSGATYVIALGNDGLCTTTGGSGSLAAQSSASGSVNFNGNLHDHIALFNVTTLIDSWGVFGSNNWAPASVGSEGADFRRKTNVIPLPNTVYNNNDWFIFDYAGSGNSANCINNDYSNIGAYSLPTSNYEYSIDNGVTYQAGLTFNNLAPGNHILIVRDLITGCLSAPVNVVIDSINPIPSVTTFTYTTPVCQNATTNPLPDTSASGFTSGGVFTSSPPTGIDLNPTTGEINLAGTTAGSYDITYTFAFNPSTCQSYSTSTFTIVIANITTPVLGFDYTTPICKNAQATLSPNLTGGFTAGGTFSSTTGLSIEASTGVIDLTTSTAGLYTVTYTVAGNTCQASGSSTFAITINPVITPTTTFSYVTPVCVNSLSNPLPNTSAIGFTNGGIFSSNPSTGIDINPTTGEITLLNTTAGTYVINYTVAANSATCQITNSTDFTIVINPIVNPVLGFSYATPICQNAQATLSPTFVTGFTTGGTFSSTTGLSINGTTGVIDLATSTSGNYTITYTSNPNVPSCLISGTNTFNIVINPLITPVTGFSYSTPFCSSDSVTLQLPTLTSGFTLGGTFSSTPGLNINGTTGEINIPNSTPGIYTITYAIAANAATCQVAATNSTQVIIIPPVTIELSGGCQSVNYILTATPVNGSFIPETASYSWQNAAGIEVGTTQSITVTDVDVYTVTITVDGCSTESLPFDVTSVSCVIQKGISVNNDGLNDTFDLTGFNVKKLTIFNRLGMKVYTRSNYVDEWGGKSDDGEELPDGTYYYVIDRNNGEAKTGWIYINRAQ